MNSADKCYAIPPMTGGVAANKLGNKGSSQR